MVSKCPYFLCLCVFPGFYRREEEIKKLCAYMIIKLILCVCNFLKYETIFHSLRAYYAGGSELEAKENLDLQSDL